MLEALLLLAIVLFLPLFGASSFVLLAAILLWTMFSLPGAWLIFRGAPPLVPTPKRTVMRMTELAAIKPGETFYDLGCGDGRLVFAAADKGAKATGYEFSLLAWLWAVLFSWRHPGAQIRFANFWKQDLRDADVIVCYLLRQLMPRFRDEIWTNLKPGTRVLSHGFSIPELTPVHEEQGIHMYVK